jgi:hypothetical protein
MLSQTEMSEIPWFCRRRNRKPYTGLKDGMDLSSAMAQ